MCCDAVWVAHPWSVFWGLPSICKLWRVAWQQDQKVWNSKMKMQYHWANQTSRRVWPYQMHTQNHKFCPRCFHKLPNSTVTIFILEKGWNGAVAASFPEPIWARAVGMKTGGVMTSLQVIVQMACNVLTIALSGNVRVQKCDWRRSATAHPGGLEGKGLWYPLFLHVFSVQ